MRNDLPVSDPPVQNLETAYGSVALTREGDQQLPLLICVHGIPGSHRDFRYLAPHLVERFHVVRLDMPGFGDAPFGNSETIESWAELLPATAEALGSSRFSLLGHSFGGGPVILAASAHPAGLDYVFLLASIGHRQHRGFGTVPPVLYRILAVLSRLPGFKTYIEHTTRIQYERRHLRPPDKGDMRSIRRQLNLIGSVNFEKIRTKAALIQAPTFLFHCRDDHLVQEAIPREFVNIVPHAYLEQFPDGGHHLQKSRATEIAQFIRNIQVSMEAMGSER